MRKGAITSKISFAESVGLGVVNYAGKLKEALMKGLAGMTEQQQAGREKKEPAVTVSEFSHSLNFTCSHVYIKSTQKITRGFHVLSYHSSALPDSASCVDAQQEQRTLRHMWCHTHVAPVSQAVRRGWA